MSEILDYFDTFVDSDFLYDIVNNEYDYAFIDGDDITYIITSSSKYSVVTLEFNGRVLDSITLSSVIRDVDEYEIIEQNIVIDIGKVDNIDLPSDIAQYDD